VITRLPWAPFLTIRIRLHTTLAQRAALLTESIRRVQMVKSLIGPRTKLVSLVHVSNMLGAILPAEEVVAAAQKARPCLQ
jgi:selenocysteine lyase/cysteine desulfurase